MKCDYCESSFNVSKFTYYGKDYKGRRRRKTLKFCLTCQCHGVASSREKVGELFDAVISDTIRCADGSEMYAY